MMGNDSWRGGFLKVRNILWYSGIIWLYLTSYK
jgi:hypothetical protein